MLKVNAMTVRNWISEGQLPAVRAGQRRVRVRRSDLDQFLDHAGALAQPRRETIDELQDQIKGLRARVELLERAEQERLG